MMPPMSYRIAVLALILITVAWGTTFVVVKETLTTVPAPWLLAMRFSLAAACFAWVAPPRGPRAHTAWVPAILLGIAAFAGFATQTVGLTTTTASKAAFVTGLSVVLTPMTAAIWFRRPVPMRVWFAAALALMGLAALTTAGGDPGTGIGRAPFVVGDVWVLGTAVAYAVYIVYLGEVAHRATPTFLSGAQHLPMAGLAWLWAASSGAPWPQWTWESIGAIAYLAVVCTAIVALLQVYAQRVVPAHVAALIFVLEPVFAASFAAVTLGERLGAAGWIGGATVVAAMFVSELGAKKPQERRDVRTAVE